MLKLEKDTRRSHITVSLRAREPFFNSILLKALSFAIILHLGALFLFHIRPFKLMSSFLFPPVQVQTNHELLPSPSLSLIPAEESKEKNFLIPPLPTTGLPPSLPLSLSFSSNENLAASSLTHSLFSDLEHDQWPLTQPEYQKIALHKPAVSLISSGDLAQLPIIESDPRLENTVQLKTPGQDPFFVTYHVRVDEKSGTIFWYERTQPSGLAEIDGLTEEMLLNLRFDTAKALAPFPSGSIHFTVYSIND